MAVSIITLEAPTGARQFQDTNSQNVAVAVKASSGTIYTIIIDNTANGVASFVKLWDLASGSVTVGGTAPDWIVKIPAGVKRTLAIPEGIAFANALSVATVTAGGTAGTTNPTSAVAVQIVFA